MQTDAKSDLLKREGKGALFSVPSDAQDRVEGTKINSSEGALDGTIDGAPEYTSASAP